MIPRRVFGLCPSDHTPRWWIEYQTYLEEYGGDRRKFIHTDIYPVAHGMNDQDLVSRINGATDQKAV